MHPLEIADNSAYRDLHNHWLECCSATAAHPLDDKDLCEKGKDLYRKAMEAQAAWFAHLNPVSQS